MKNLDLNKVGEKVNNNSKTIDEALKISKNDQSLLPSSSEKKFKICKRKLYFQIKQKYADPLVFLQNRRF